MKLLHHIGVELTAVKREARVALEKKRHARSNVPAWPGRLQFSVKLSARPSKRPVSGSVQAAAAAKKRRPCPCRPPLPLNSDHVLFHSASREGTPSHDAVCSAVSPWFCRVGFERCESLHIWHRVFDTCCCLCVLSNLDLL
jgi:hypothetical protein